MTKALATLKEEFNLETFDPMSIDISEFRKLAEELPQNDVIDIAMAEHLAITYLRAADRSSEIISTLLKHIKKLKVDMECLKGELYLRAAQEGYKTVEDKKAYSVSHKDYKEISYKYAETEAVLSWFEAKNRCFLEAHRLMKAKFKSESQHMMSSGFSETAGKTVDKIENSFGEKEW